MDVVGCCSRPAGIALVVLCSIVFVSPIALLDQRSWQRQGWRQKLVPDARSIPIDDTPLHGNAPA